MTTHATDRDFENNFDFIYYMAGFIKLQVEGTFGEDGVDDIQVYCIQDPESDHSDVTDISGELKSLYMPLPRSSVRVPQSVLDDIMGQALERRNEG